MLVVPLFWSGNVVLGRAMHDAIPPVAISFWRWTGAALVSLPFAWPHLLRDAPVLRARLPVMLLLSLTGIAAYNTMAYTGLQTTTAINGLLLQSAMPLMVLIWAFALHAERPGALEAAGIVVSMAGVAVIAGQGSLDVLLHLRVVAGDWWFLGALFIYALYSVLLRRRPAVHPLSFATTTFAFGAAMVAPLYLLEMASGRHMEHSTAVWATLLYVAVFPSFLAYLAFNRGVELMGAARAGQYVHLMPVFGTALAVLALGEQVRLFHVVGIALIAAGLVMAQRRRPVIRSARPSPGA